LKSVRRFAARVGAPRIRAGTGSEREGALVANGTTVVHVGSQIHRGTDVVDELETAVACRVLANSAVAVSVSVREGTLVSNPSTVVLIAGSIDGGTGRLREEKTEESGSLELVTALATSKRAVAVVA